MLVVMATEPLVETNEDLLALGRRVLVDALEWWGLPVRGDGQWSPEWADPDNDKGSVIAAQLGMLSSVPPQEPILTAAAKLVGIAPATARQWRTRDKAFKNASDLLAGYWWTLQRDRWKAWVAYDENRWAHYEATGEWLGPYVEHGRTGWSGR